MHRLKSVVGAVIFMVFCAGAALAMPTSGFDPAATETTEEAGQDPALAAALEEVEIVEGETTDVTVPDEDEDGDEDGSDHPENHGKAVSTAAHCDLKGRAHGALVRSIAHDKSATAESAQAACDAAIAAAAAETTAASKGKPAKASKVKAVTRAPKSTSDSPGQAKKATVQATETVEAAPSGPSAGKGNPHKP